MMEYLFSDSLWRVVYFNNELWSYAIFAALSIFLSVGFFTLKYIIFKKISERLKEQKIFHLLIDILENIRSPFYVFVSFYVSLSLLEIPEILSTLFFIIFLLWSSYRVVIIGYQFIDFFFSEFALKRTERDSEAMIRTMSNIAKGILWVFAALVILSFAGVNVTGLVAGMGIGGIAIAFALQGILSDLFSSFSIYFDKPFVEGDFITVGDKMGTVEKIGIKSTRIRALQGEEIIISNKELTTAQVHNLRRMTRRRGTIDLGVVYGTTNKKMEKIPDIVKKIIEKEELAEFDRTNFSAFNNFSLNYIVVYYIESPDYKIFMEVTERILLAIKREFEKEKIEFAYPTSTIHLNKS